ncbi:tyrosine-type recombinase/integrase [Streptomyces parvulus]|uniref:tyrosine-type recombinase/integrase n=1 Tax=Streptomyces parvulus TaxID=146923 RepID=UPI003700A947
MQLYFANHRALWRVGDVAGIDRALLETSLERHRLPAGTPVLLDDAMRPVEPLSSWFRRLAWRRTAAKTMRTYAYAVLRLLGFLQARGRDLRSAIESDIVQFEQWRREHAEETVEEPTWDKDAAAIGQLYDFLVDIGYVAARPWRSTSRGTSLGSGKSTDVRVRHMEIDQYIFLRDVGFGGLTPDASLDVSFRGWRPHRNRAACELALLTGMRIQEWSTLLLPELGLAPGIRPRTADVDLATCAKRKQRRSVYVPVDAMELLDPYLTIERPEIVEAAQRTLRRQHRDLFVVTGMEAEGRRLRGVLEGRAVTRVVKDMAPDLRRITVLETGDGLEPLALFVGRGGKMLSASGWDRVRWRAWDRMVTWSTHQDAPVTPRLCWCYHDLRHTFALRLLVFLTREALGDAGAQELPMATLLDHMTGNPLLTVQHRLGHLRPSTTYRYVRYLKDPMREVDDAFRQWTAAGGASYITIARHMMSLEEHAHA